MINDDDDDDDDHDLIRLPKGKTDHNNFKCERNDNF